MRRSHRHAWWAAMIVVLMAAGWAWQHQERWWPQAQERLALAWDGLRRPDDSTLPKGGGVHGARERRSSAKSSAAAHSQPAPHGTKKCTSPSGQVSYTDQECPSGWQQQWLDEEAGAVVRVVPARSQP
ncbi:hypothetical protein [Diaphorobacter sp.]|uniref:hypothetical protein n=1 Tax=Diaphorobacter sp. TaxID=1934310 RepID=UPI0028A9467A|nr:hypothetical protein [Diaphorobacter sp.]